MFIDDVVPPRICENDDCPARFLCRITGYSLGYATSKQIRFQRIQVTVSYYVETSHFIVIAVRWHNQQTHTGILVSQLASAKMPTGRTRALHRSYVRIA